MSRSFRTPRRAATLVPVAVATLALTQSSASASSGDRQHDPIVLGNVHSVDQPQAYWTAKRMKRAKALPLVQLSQRTGSDLEAAPRGSAHPSYVPPAKPRASGVAAERRGRLSRGSAAKVDGTDTGSPTAYPASANGVVYGTYAIDGQAENYRCSGSVINTTGGSVVLTAGHCVIDADSGARAQSLVFVPGYRNGKEPYGEWSASKFATTWKWRSTAGTPSTDEAGDMTMLTVNKRAGKSLQSVVGALGIGFHQGRNKTYTQYGYPAASPYDGSRLYALRSGYAGADAYFSPPTMAIRSDFTGGSSGGPWVVGSAPVALSVTDYSYLYPPSLADYMFGPYFGTVAQKLYRSVGGSEQGSSSTSTIPSARFSIVDVVNHRRRGTATIKVSVPNGGTLTLSGSNLKSVSKTVQSKGEYPLLVTATGSAAQQLQQSGRVTVGARIRFAVSAAKASSKYRRLTLIKRLQAKRHR